MTCDRAAELISPLLDGELDLVTAVDAGDAEGFNRALSALLDKVRQVGTALPDEEIVPSDLVLPSADASLDEVRELLGDEGLIPG